MNENERRVRFGVGGQGVRARFHNAVIRVTLDARPEFWRVFHAAAALRRVGCNWPTPGTFALINLYLFSLALLVLGGVTRRI